MARIQSIRGMNDILPTETPVWQYVEARVRDVLARYGYSEIRFPIVEHTELFKRSIGEVTDIVEKEMYTFDDRNGDSLTLRPEGTASCVRACDQNGLLHNQIQRLWYTGPMFRHERPQKAGCANFIKLVLKPLGWLYPDIDAELILLTARLWRELGISDALTLELNSIGNAESRANYRQALVDYLRGFQDELDEDSKRRLETNPLRVLDSKDPNTRELLVAAPVLSDYLDDISRSHFEGLCARLDAVGIPYTLNPQLVRGLDYYGLTVFEWTTDSLGAQGTVCAGGRYDGLVEQLGGKATPAVGFAMGIERLVLMLETLNVAPEIQPQADIFIVSVGEKADIAALQIAEQLRDAMPSVKVLINCGGGSFKSQFKKADKSGASLAVVLGEDELQGGEAAVKPLRAGQGEQQLVALAELVNHISKNHF